MADVKSGGQDQKPSPSQAPKVRPKAEPNPPVDPASLIPAQFLVKYQAAPGKMLPVKCGGKFVFVRSDKPCSFDKRGLKLQMKQIIAQEIKAGRLKEV